MAEKVRNRDIRNILIVLGSAVFGAALLTLFFLTYYGPTGRYVAGNTLLDPAILEEIRYQDPHPSTGKKVQFVFDRVELAYWDPSAHQVRSAPLSLKSYEIFYHKVAEEKSLLGNIHAIESLFLQSRPALLTISMQTKQGNEAKAGKIFQMVEFVPEDYFRVLLHEKEEGEWSYFYKKGLYQEIISLYEQ